VFVGDEDRVEFVDILADGSEACQRLAFTKAGVNKDAGTFGFEQRQVARTAGRKDVNAQADCNSPETPNVIKLFRSWQSAEGASTVSANGCEFLGTRRGRIEKRPRNSSSIEEVFLSSKTRLGMAIYFLFFYGV
jgi:hypothetical protein